MVSRTHYSDPMFSIVMTPNRIGQHGVCVPIDSGFRSVCGGGAGVCVYVWGWILVSVVLCRCVYVCERGVLSGGGLYKEESRGTCYNISHRSVFYLPNMVACTSHTITQSPWGSTMQNTTLFPTHR